MSFKNVLLRLDQLSTASCPRTVFTLRGLSHHIFSHDERLTGKNICKPLCSNYKCTVFKTFKHFKIIIVWRGVPEKKKPWSILPWLLSVMSKTWELLAEINTFLPKLHLVMLVYHSNSNPNKDMMVTLMVEADIQGGLQASMVICCLLFIKFGNTLLIFQKSFRKFIRKMHTFHLVSKAWGLWLDSLSSGQSLLLNCYTVLGKGHHLCMPYFLGSVRW